jgi:hypothetical protein
MLHPVKHELRLELAESAPVPIYQVRVFQPQKEKYSHILLLLLRMFSFYS